MHISQSASQEISLRKCKILTSCQLSIRMLPTVPRLGGESNQMQNLWGNMLYHCNHRKEMRHNLTLDWKQ